jgi:NADH dehydrogenase
VQISAIGASADSASAYARTKAAGEVAVRELIPGATILQPSVIFGPEDAFFNRFAEMAMISPALPLIGGGHTRFQPVFVADVAAAVAEAIWSPAAAGRDYELGGPGVYSFKELMEVMLKVIGRRRVLAPVPFGVAGLLGAAGDAMTFLPFPPPITSDQVELLKTDNVCAPGSAGLADLDVTPSPLEAIIPTYLYRYRKGGQYAEALEAAAALPAR